MSNEQVRVLPFSFPVPTFSPFSVHVSSHEGATWEMLERLHLIRWGKLQFPTVTFPAIHYTTREFVKLKFQSWKLRSCSFPHNKQRQSTHTHRASSIVLNIAFIFTSRCIFIPRHNLLWFQLNRVITFAVEACLRARWFCLNFFPICVFRFSCDSRGIRNEFAEKQKMLISLKLQGSCLADEFMSVPRASRKVEKSQFPFFPLFRKVPESSSYFSSGNATYLSPTRIAWKNSGVIESGNNFP